MKTAQIPHEGFPLQWPIGRARRAPHKREKGAFQVTFGRARNDLLSELRTWSARNIVISSNVPLKRDGFPYADYRTPSDPGVAVYFEHRGHVRCIACDTYRTVEANLRGVGLTIAALRSVERYGGVESLDQAYEGFKVLPAAGQTTRRSWWEVLGVAAHASTIEIKSAYRTKAHTLHPDKGNSDAEAWHELQQAYESALTDRGL